MPNLEDLDPDGLADSPDDPAREQAMEAARHEAEEFLAEIERLVDEEHVQYARETLEDIQATVERTGRVTEAQRRAVANIDEGGQRWEDGRFRRW